MTQEINSDDLRKALTIVKTMLASKGVLDAEKNSELWEWYMVCAPPLLMKMAQRAHSITRTLEKWPITGSVNMNQIVANTPES